MAVTRGVSGHPGRVVLDPALLSVGAVSELLGVPRPTLRTWERRYRLGPSGRTAGGHRRYTNADVTRLALMLGMTAGGVGALEAAVIVKRIPEDRLDDKLAELSPAEEPDSHDKWSPSDLIDQAIRAASEFDTPRLNLLCTTAIDRLGFVPAWDDVIAPMLVEIGQRWRSGEIGVEVEHLTTSCLLTLLRSHTVPAKMQDCRTRPIILASAEHDQHKLPVVAMEAALSIEGIATLNLGARLPAVSLRRVIDSLQPSGVFLWASVSRPDPDPITAVLENAPSSMTILIGGPGWPDDLSYPRSWSLAEAVGQVKEFTGAGRF